MSSKKKLTKADILKGKERQEAVYLNEYAAEVLIRPLTDGELTEVFSLLGTLPLNDDGTPDMSQIDVIKNLDALRFAASRGLVEPQLTVDEVAEMKFGVPELIGTKVLELSGVTAGAEASKKKS
jgi:hypothetical protein